MIMHALQVPAQLLATVAAVLWDPVRENPPIATVIFCVISSKIAAPMLRHSHNVK